MGVVDRLELFGGEKNIGAFTHAFLYFVKSFCREEPEDTGIARKYCIAAGNQHPSPREVKRASELFNVILSEIIIQLVKVPPQQTPIAETSQAIRESVESMSRSYRRSPLTRRFFGDDSILVPGASDEELRHISETFLALARPHYSSAILNLVIRQLTC